MSTSSQYGVPLIINDRLDIALAIGGCGLHVGQDDMQGMSAALALPSLSCSSFCSKRHIAKVARKLLGPDLLLGVSINTEEELGEALSDNVVDYIGIGPAYDTNTKKDLHTLLGTRGVTRILGVLGDSPIKAVVIGGIQPSTIPNVLRQCAAPLPDGSYRTLDGLAIVSSIAASLDPKTATKELLSLFSQQPSYPLPTNSSSFSVDSIISTASDLLQKLRDGPSPLIHHITNNVVMNDTANLTLAFSASPIMSGAAAEAAELGIMVGALLINFGTVSEAQLACQLEAGLTANRLGKPIVFDPVGVGATSFRKYSVNSQSCFRSLPQISLILHPLIPPDLMSAVHMSIVKGNAGSCWAKL